MGLANTSIFWKGKSSDSPAPTPRMRPSRCRLAWMPMQAKGHLDAAVTVLRCSHILKEGCREGLTVNTGISQ